MITRHGVPATLTSTGRVVQSWDPGPADRLTGIPRLVEIWARFRHAHPRPQAARLLYAAWRHGVALSGTPVTNMQVPR